jgi:hypothetical protein
MELVIRSFPGPPLKARLSNGFIEEEEDNANRDK